MVGHTTTAVQRPVCGGGTVDDSTYDFPLHLAAVFIVFFASSLGAGFPVMAKRLTWLRIPAAVFFFCKHFGTGVLVATAFVHLLPTAFGSLTDPCLPPFFTEVYPALAGVIMMTAMLLLFLIEMKLHASGNGHSHGGPTGVIDAHAHSHTLRHMKSTDSQTTLAYKLDSHVKFDDEKFGTGEIWDPRIDYGSDMPPWFLRFYDQYLTEMKDVRRAVKQQRPLSTFAEPDVEKAVSPEELKRMSMNVTLLEGGVLFHSIFIGITLSVTTDGFPLFLTAILFHQLFEGLGLGSRIAAIPFPARTVRPWLMVAAFGLTTPIGQIIGLATRGLYDPAGAVALVMLGVFNSISAGLLVWAALVDLLAEDFLSEESFRVMRGPKRALAFFYLIIGAVGMSIIGAFA